MSPFLAVDVEAVRPTLSIAARFEADAGTTVALLGPNGAGKSTVLEVLVGVLPARRAAIEVDGVRIDGLPPERRPIGVAFQGARLFPTMSVLENVAFPLRARGSPKPDAHRRSRAMLEGVGGGISPAAKPRTLSGGQAQRAALARALVAGPKLLLLDEPLAAVDVSARADLRTLLRRVTSAFSGVTVLVAHDPIDALTLADRIVVLEDGTVTQVGTPRDLRGSPTTPYVADLVGVNLLSGRLTASDGGVATLATPGGGTVIVALPQGGVRASGDAMATLAPSDVALHLTEPEGSARNVFRGAVEEVAIVGDRVRVRLATRPPLVAEVTRGSVDRLGLEPGLQVYASCKAVEVRVVDGGAGTLGG